MLRQSMQSYLRQMKTLEPRKERVIITVIKPGIVNNTWRGELMTQDHGGTRTDTRY
jgi:hypothetical protein